MKKVGGKAATARRFQSAANGYAVGAHVFVDANGVTGFAGGTLHVNAAPPPPAVPEPVTWAMMLLGFLGIGFLAYRRGEPAGQFRAV